jgi:hypothetical protein
MKKLPKLAIVGSHSATRELAPYEDSNYEIWLFNEAAMKPEVYRRWDGLLQIHRPEVYTSLDNWVNKDHWAWLQQDHGSGKFGRKRIFMQRADERVPNSVAYPLEGVLGLVPYHYLRSSPALALALGIYLGYKEIALYGSDLVSGTEYAYQATNLAFWIGFAHGLGIKLDLQCWQSEFNQPIYGYEGEPQIKKEFFEQRVKENERAWISNEKVLKDTKDRLNTALWKCDMDRVGALIAELQMVAQTTGETAGALGEAERYLKREGEISRQEFERVSTQAQIDGEKLQQQVWHEGGKCEYVWNVWRMSGRNEALQQLRQFIDNQTQYSYDMGARLGIFRENILYMNEYDALVTALGGQRALSQIGK